MCFVEFVFNFCEEKMMLKGSYFKKHKYEIIFGLFCASLIMLVASQRLLDDDKSFNELLNSYYTAYRHIEIILFSNTVSSIDMRRRFLVAGNTVLKIRIIKKS